MGGQVGGTRLKPTTPLHPRTSRVKRNSLLADTQELRPGRTQILSSDDPTPTRMLRNNRERKRQGKRIRRYREKDLSKKKQRKEDGENTLGEMATINVGACAVRGEQRNFREKGCCFVETIEKNGKRVAE